MAFLYSLPVCLSLVLSFFSKLVLPHIFDKEGRDPPYLEMWAFIDMQKYMQTASRKNPAAVLIGKRAKDFPTHRDEDEGERLW